MYVDITLCTDRMEKHQKAFDIVVMKCRSKTNCHKKPSYFYNIIKYLIAETMDMRTPQKSYTASWWVEGELKSAAARIPATPHGHTPQTGGGVAPQTNEHFQATLSG